MRFWLFLTFIAVTVYTRDVSAQSHPSCLPQWNSLQSVETFDANQDYDFNHVLVSENASGRFPTKVVVDGHYSASTHQLILKTHFDDKFNGVSLPYNLFAALVIENGEVNAWQDFTKACMGPGVGFFPGSTFQLPPMKLKSSGKALVQIMLWGMIN